MVRSKLSDISKRVEKLKSLIEYHRKKYHEEDSPEISDEAYDSLLRELEGLEFQYPETKTVDSPTARIGGAPRESFTKVTHQVPQWSFDNVFSFDELSQWALRMRRFLEKESRIASPQFSYCAEHKIDGLKIVLTYKNGLFVQGATRGDGQVGEDITDNVKTIDSIPLSLPHLIDLIVVGEAWLSEEELHRINSKRKLNNEPLFANTRNAAAGSLRQLDPKIARSRKLSAFVYDVDFFDAKNTKLKRPETQKDELLFLKGCGFPVNTHFKVCASIDEIESYYNIWLHKKNELPYGVDGIAIKVNERSVQDALGYTAKAPRFGVAYKFPATQVTTVVLDIALQVGRTGVLTPVAKLQPVLVDGSTVSRATLHNEDEIRRLDVRIGDTVILQKAGDVIPDIVRVLKELRTGKEKPFIFPKRVPECGGDGSIERIPGQAAYRCVYRNSDIQQRRKLEYFVSKKAFDIPGLGKKIIEQFMEENIVSSYSDIFSLAKGDIVHLPGFGDVSATKLITAIDKARKVSLDRLLVSLSIPQVGEETAYDLAREFKTLEKVRNASFPILESVDGVGPIIAQSVRDWFDDEQNKKNLDQLLSFITVVSFVDEAESKIFAGKTFVLTGTLKDFSRDEAKAFIKKHGGSVSSSVSVNTDFVVVGDNPGDKYEQALKLGIPVLSEKDLISEIAKNRKKT